MQQPTALLCSIFTILLISNIGCAQIPLNKPTTLEPAFDKKLERMLDFSVPLMSVQQLKQKQNSVALFDTRELEEFKVSHIRGAQYLGYKDFQPARLGLLPKDTTIVLYCSVGYRSEKIGEKLKKLGFQKVYNLYGSIFEWANNGYELIDDKGQPTKKLHTYNKNWGQWVDGKKVEKEW